MSTNMRRERTARLVLGLPCEEADLRVRVDPSVLKRAYRDMARRHHPDKPGGSTQKMQALTAAFRYLAGIRSDTQEKAWDAMRKESRSIIAEPAVEKTFDVDKFNDHFIRYQSQEGWASSGHGKWLRDDVDRPHRCKQEAGRDLVHVDVVGQDATLLGLTTSTAIECFVDHSEQAMMVANGGGRRRLPTMTDLKVAFSVDATVVAETQDRRATTLEQYRTLRNSPDALIPTASDVEQVDRALEALRTGEATRLDRLAQQDEDLQRHAVIARQAWIA
jgi:hypothetical protein